MSPEQARGRHRQAHRHLGVRLRALRDATGAPVFSGESTTDILAAILEREPDWRALPAETTPALRRLLRRCLDKDPRRRLRDIGDIALEQPEEVDRATARTTPIGRWLLTVAAALATGAGLGWLVAGSISSATVTPAPLRVFIDTLAEGRQFEGGSAGTGSMVALSPDGRTLAYVAEESGRTSPVRPATRSSRSSQSRADTRSGRPRAILLARWRVAGVPCRPDAQARVFKGWSSRVASRSSSRQREHSRRQLGRRRHHPGRHGPGRAGAHPNV